MPKINKQTKLQPKYLSITPKINNLKFQIGFRVSLRDTDHCFSDFVQNMKTLLAHVLGKVEVLGSLCRVHLKEVLGLGQQLNVALWLQHKFPILGCSFHFSALLPLILRDHNMKNKNEEMIFQFERLRHTNLGQLKYHILLNSFPPDLGVSVLILLGHSHSESSRLDDNLVLPSWFQILWG